MKRLCGLVATLLVFGCAGADQRPPKIVYTGSYFGGAKGGPLNCTHHSCAVDIIDPSCSGSVCGGSLSYDPINLANGTGGKMITWTLPSGYAFCKQVGDGVFLKDENSDQFKLETYNGDATCSDKFTIMAANTKPRPNVGYHYKVIFHKVDTSTNPYGIDPTMYTIDPSMVNK